MKKDEVANLLLSSATEDWIGLYEAIWEVNGRFPKETLGWKYDMAREALGNLFQRGWIQFERKFGGRDSQRVQTIGAAEVIAMLDNPVSWYPEYDGSSVFFACTDAGHKSYMASPN